MAVTLEALAKFAPKFAPKFVAFITPDVTAFAFDTALLVILVIFFETVFVIALDAFFPTVFAVERPVEANSFSPILASAPTPKGLAPTDNDSVTPAPAFMDFVSVDAEEVPVVSVVPDVSVVPVYKCMGGESLSVGGRSETG